MTDSIRDLLSATADRAIRYLEEIDARPVGPTAASIRALTQFDEPLPDRPTAPGAVLEQLDRVGSPATVASAGGRFFGLVVGGALPATLAAHWLADVWDQESGLEAAAPSAVAIETVAHRWLLELFGLPSDCATAFVTGATMANFSGLAAARGALLARVGWDVEADGLQGAPPLTVVVGEEVHASVLKALGLLGLGRDRAVVVPADRQGRMMVERLPPIEGPTIVCAQAGNVNSGASDPFREIAVRVNEQGGWLHIDGAFGLWAAIAETRSHLVDGFREADSWATDAHKWLNVPYDCGLAFVRDAEALRRAMGVPAAYFPPGAGRQPDHYTPEFSRRARGVEVWAAIKSLGRTGIAELVERCCRHAERFAAGLRAAGLEILNEVVLNQVVVTFGDEPTTDRVIARVQRDGVCWCGGTTWKGRRAMRISVSSWVTTEADVDRSVAAIAAAARAEGARD
jgi:glutamate/tyrosine decarboxylase-like PLP-dependent enzyme